jgi:hypothetical protein
MNEMSKNIERYLSHLPYGATVLDVGSMDVNGSYRGLFEPYFNYVGADIAPGKSVNIVMPSEYSTGLPGRSVDVVVSGQCLEHVRDPFALTEEMFRVAKDTVMITAPWKWVIHRHPLDCWRILPDGMRALIERYGECLDSYIVEYDTWGIGKANG